MWKIGCWGRDTAGDSGFFPFFLSPPSFFFWKRQVAVVVGGDDRIRSRRRVFFLPQEVEQPIRLFRPRPIVLLSAVIRSAQVRSARVWF